MSTPKVRFKGFTDDWEQRKLGDVIDDLKSGLSRELQLDDIGIPVVRANNVDDNKLDMKSEVKYWYKDDPQGANTSNYLIHKDDILINFINSEAKMGTAAIVEDEPLRDTIYTTNILRLRTNEELHPYFFLMETNLAEYKSFIKAITKPAVNQASFTTVDYKKYDIEIPDYKEQARIGGFFKKLENLITLYQRKCDELQKVKKYMLQKMFPEKGEKVPEIRFAGFTDDWEQRKLGELAEFNPKSILPDEFEYVDLESVVGTEIIAHRKETKETAPSRAQRLAEQGDVFYQTVRPYQRNNCLFEGADEEYVFSTGYAQMRPHGDSYFLLTLLQKDEFVNEVLDRCTGTSYPAINSNVLAGLTVRCPANLDEQNKVGNYFKLIDNLIALHQRKHETLKEIKKYMLQNMFPKE